MKASKFIKLTGSYQTKSINVEQKVDYIKVTQKDEDNMLFCRDVVAAAHALMMSFYFVSENNRPVLIIYDKKD